MSETKQDCALRAAVLAAIARDDFRTTTIDGLAQRMSSLSGFPHTASMVGQILEGERPVGFYDRQTFREFLTARGCVVPA